MSKRKNELLAKLESVLSVSNIELLEELLSAEYDSGFDDGYENGKSDYISEASEPESRNVLDEYEDIDDPNDYPPEPQEF